MTNYQKWYQARKAEVEAEAIEWQLDFANHDYSWGELAKWGDHFGELGKRFGLMREFRENGII